MTLSHISFGIRLLPSLCGAGNNGFLAESLLFLKPSLLLMSKPFLCWFLLRNCNLAFSPFISNCIISDIWLLTPAWNHSIHGSTAQQISALKLLRSQDSPHCIWPPKHLAQRYTLSHLDRMLANISDPVDRVNPLIVVRKLQVSPTGSCESSGHPELMVRSHNSKDFSVFACSHIHIHSTAFSVLCKLEKKGKEWEKCLSRDLPKLYTEWTSGAVLEALPLMFKWWDCWRTSTKYRIQLLAELSGLCILQLVWMLLTSRKNVGFQISPTSANLVDHPKEATATLVEHSHHTTFHPSWFPNDGRLDKNDRGNSPWSCLEVRKLYGTSVLELQ